MIGYGSKLQGTNAVHGAPLGEEDGAYAKEQYGWNHEPFAIPQEVYDHFEQSVKVRGQESNQAWDKLFSDYSKQYPELAKELEKAINNELVVDLETVMPTYEVGHSQATRDTNHEAINAISEVIPYFLGGSADLSHSNKTNIKNGGDFSKVTPSGRNIYFGVREFAMASILNGMMLHGGVRVFGGTFFVFCDYLKPAMRMAALMGLPVTYVLTHDSIAVGEDGPTHEPIEQLAMLRTIPNFSVIRPADANETAAAWRLAMESKSTPTALILTRQNLTTMANTTYEGVSKGAYVVSEAQKEMDGILIATGSEVNLAVAAQTALAAEGIHVRVVSMPSMDLFEKQPKEYRELILPKSVTKRLAIEMGATYGWHKYVGFEGDVLGIDRFGASAPANKVIEAYGFTVENVVSLYKAL